MTQSDSFSCPHCQQVYKRGNSTAGKKVRCQKCEQPFVVPETEPAASKAPRAVSRGTSSSSRSRGAASSKKRRNTKAQPQSNKQPMVMLVGALLVVGVLAGLYFGGVFGGAEAKKPEPVVQKPKEKTPTEKYEAALEAAAKSGSKELMVAKYGEAIDLLESNSIKDARFSVEELHQKIIEADPDNQKSRTALGFTKYSGDFERYANQWVPLSDLSKIQKEYKKWQAEQAVKKQEAKWDKDAFARKAAKIRDYFNKKAEKVPDFKFTYFFDTEDVPRPFLFIVQDVETPSPEQSVAIVAPGIVELRRQFKEGYPKGTIPSWSDTDAVVPIVLFKDTAGYEHYGKHVKEHYGAPSDVAAAFYRFTPYEDAPVNTFRGIMFCWPGRSDKQFYRSLLHEATHQIVHNASIDGSMGRTPWLQEGIAEWWSAFEGSRHSGYKFGLFQNGRYARAKAAADLYYKKIKDGNGYFTLKRLTNISSHQFDAWRSRRSEADKEKISLIYAQGWAFLYFCYYYEDEDYEGEDEAKKYPFRKAFLKFMYDELRHELKPESVAKYLGIKTEDDWKKLNDEFFFFCKRTMRRWQE
ncbi:MAG: hypothetical protein CSA62_02810 [Planctomycetota bacterium]|nr:MAG: hypothetical protein CSA62_02810 [Planctomycetota bacterium]